ncbi:MAG: hypothetical protein HOQ24_08025 [Mycobacteriaceae bacterium]|nr:hypothetical protein [Mycobacteriaceae bacterium]
MKKIDYDEIDRIARELDAVATNLARLEPKLVQAIANLNQGYYGQAAMEATALLGKVPPKLRSYVVHLQQVQQVTANALGSQGRFKQMEQKHSTMWRKFEV